MRAYLTPIPATVSDRRTHVSVVVKTDPDAIATPEALASLAARPRRSFGDVAEITQGSSPIAVTHFDGNRSAEVSAVITDPNFGAVNMEVQLRWATWRSRRGWKRAWAEQQSSNRRASPAS